MRDTDYVMREATHKLEIRETRWRGGKQTAQRYRDLEIYQLAHRLAVEVHSVSLSLPRVEAFEEASQVRRATKSVSANIVEGFGRRRYKAAFIKLLTYAHASGDETQEHLRLLWECSSLSEESFRRLDSEYNTLGRMLNGFIRAVDAEHLT